MSFVGLFWDGLPGAVSVSRDGTAGAAPFAYRHARGLDPSVSTIAFPRSMFTDESLGPLLSAAPFDLVPEISPAALGDMEASPGLPPRTERPPFCGDLWIVQKFEGEEQRRQLVARQLYFVEAVLDHSDLEVPLVVLTLSDIRRFWDGHGSVTRRWNVRLGPSDSDLVEELAPPADTLSLSTQERTAPRVFETDTAKERGTQPFTLREIVQELLNALPGRVQLVRWPLDVGEGANAPEVKAWAASPKEALARLLDAYRLVFGLGPDMRGRVYKVGEGTIGELVPGSEENLSSWDPASGAGPWAALVTAEGNRYSRRPTHAPDEVEVLGDRAVMEAAVDFCTPVVTYALEEQDKPPRTVVLEVTPRNLEALSRGVRKPGETAPPPDGVALPDPRDQHAVRVMLGAEAPPLPPAALRPRDTTEVQAPKILPDPFVWQRLPLAPDAGTWRHALPWATEATREMLRTQLWRRYQVPKHLRRLLPLLRRAQRDRRGERLAIHVEAFTFEPKRIAYVDDSRAVQRQHEREKALADLSMRREEIARLEARRRFLQAPEPAELARAATNYIGEVIEHNREVLGLQPGPLGTAAAVGYSLVWPLSMVDLPALSTEDAALNQADRALRRAGRSWARGLMGDPGSVRRQFLHAMNADFLAPLEAELGEGSTSESAEARIALIDTLLATHRAAAAEIEKRLNPVLDIQRQIGALEALLATQRAELGAEDPVVRASIQELQKAAEKAAAEVAEQKRQDVQTRHRLVHQNLARHPVPFRVIDEAQGIIEILGDLPCWLADTDVEDAATSYLIPMPVRITFGTTNRLDVALETGGGVTNPYMIQAAAMLAAMPSLRGFVGPLGHILPTAEGERQLRFAFRRGGTEVGDDAIGGDAYRVTVDDDPPLRELVTLGGQSNRAEQLERVLPLVRALLALPTETDAGSLTLAGPMTVGCNGRISAVETRLVNHACGFETEVAFGVDVAPLPGVLGRKVDRGPLRFVFGINVEATRNR